MPSTKRSSHRHLTELRRLQARLAETEATVKAIRSGNVDAIMVEGPKGSRVFTLQSPEEPYRILAERMNEGAATLTAEGIILFCNPRLAEMAGLPVERLMGTSFLLILPNSEQDSFPELLRQASKKDMRVEGHLRRADGAMLQVQLSLNSIPLEDSKPGICMIATDLSEQKRAEEAKASIVDGSDDAIIGKTLDGTITSWNGGAEEIYGYSAHEIMGHSISQLIPPDRLSEFNTIMEGITQRQPVRHFETVRVRKGGQRVHVSLTISPIKDAAGTVVGASTIARDITERQEAEKELRESQEQFRVLFDEMLMGFALLEPIYDEKGKPCDFRYLEVNPAHETHCGLGRDRVVGKTIREVLPTLEPIWIETFGSVAVTGESIHFDGFAEPLGRWIELTAFRTCKSQIAVTFADITERKRAEEKLRIAALYARSLIEASLDPLVTISRAG